MQPGKFPPLRQATEFLTTAILITPQMMRPAGDAFDAPSCATVKETIASFALAASAINFNPANLGDFASLLKSATPDHIEEARKEALEIAAGRRRRGGAQNDALEGIRCH
jgi:hypothetical protein